MNLLLLKLLIAHVLADFAFQPDKWIKDKLEKKQRSKYLYYHIGLHLIALLVVLGFDFSYWPAILVIIISHYLIDLIKLHLNKHVDARLLFVLDQLAHLGVIVGVVQYYEPISIDLSAFATEQVLLLVLAVLTVTSVASIIMQQLMSSWKMEDVSNDESLEKAGKYIGMLERLFVFGFIALGQWQAIGFLLAAKSVFRFGDLSNAKDRKLTEYILIGTLLSFGIAIGVGLLYLNIAQ